MMWVQLPIRRWDFLGVLWLCWSMALAADPTPSSPTDPGTKTTNSLAAVAPADEDNYRIRSGDTIDLRVYQEDDLNTRTKVDSEGYVLLPLIGRISLKGQTIAAATRLIRTRLEADFLQQARVSLSLAERAPQHFLMLGQVNRPGVYDLPSDEPLDLTKAVAMAGGFTRIASPSKVLVKRMTAGKEETLRLNAKTLSRSAAEAPFFVQADDQITIGESAF